MSTQLQREIGNLKKSILTLSALVEDNLRRALTAVERRDEALAADAIERDFPIDLMEVDVEEDCLKALALYQPVAGDLRFIVTTIKINTTLERVGDLAVNIAERARLLAAMEQPVVAFDMAGMAAKAQRMVSSALDALVHSDGAVARAVLLADDEVDDLDRELTATLQAAAREHPEWLDPHHPAPAGLALHRARGRPRDQHRRRRDLHGRGRDPAPLGQARGRRGHGLQRRRPAADQGVRGGRAAGPPAPSSGGPVRAPSSR